jgi:hypothetical protein
MPGFDRGAQAYDVSVDNDPSHRRLITKEELRVSFLHLPNSMFIIGHHTVIASPLHILRHDMHMHNNVESLNPPFSVIIHAAADRPINTTNDHFHKHGIPRPLPISFIVIPVNQTAPFKFNDTASSTAMSSLLTTLLLLVWINSAFSQPCNRGKLMI